MHAQSPFLTHQSYRHRSWLGAGVASLLFAKAASAAVLLIGPNTRNGGFESGVISPWEGGITAVHDPSFASAGEWYGRLSASRNDGLLVRQIGFQFLEANPADGLNFTATFDARTDINGFDNVFIDFFARNTNNTFISGIATPILSPALSSSEWRTFQTAFQLSPGWDGVGPISLQILFSRNSSVPGVTYSSFLDNVRLEQIPEPSSMGVFLIGAGVLGVVRRSKANSNRKT